MDGEIAIAANGDYSLREAIINANNDAATYGDCAAGAGADTIILPAGGLFSLTDYHEDFYGYTGLPVITTEITIEGDGSTIQMDATVTDNFRLLAVDSTGDLTINDLTVQDFYSSRAGGGVHVDSGTLEVNDSTFQYNYTNFHGGAIHQDGGTVTINNSTIDSNEAEQYGGGLANFDGDLTITDSTISNNVAGDGSGLYLTYGITTINRSTISGNVASDGGGIYNDDGDLYIYQSAITGNEAYSDGGGIFQPGYCECTSTLVVVNSTISGNTADYGGGIHMRGYASVTLTNVTISDNEANYSGVDSTPLKQAAA